MQCVPVNCLENIDNKGRGRVVAAAFLNWEQMLLASFFYDLTGDWSVLVYFYGPIGLMLIINIALFSVTCKSLYDIQKSLTCHQGNRKVSQWRRHTTSRATLELNRLKHRLVSYNCEFKKKDFGYAPQLILWQDHVYIVNFKPNLLLIVMVYHSLNHPKRWVFAWRLTPQDGRGRLQRAATL